MPLQVRQPATAPATQTKTEPQSAGHHDTTREIFETVVFVVVLVLMLKLFVAEAFVIPTGSMASTLWGDQVVCKCRECGHLFPINASQDSSRVAVHDYTCENCGFQCSGPDVDKDLQQWFLPRMLGLSAYSSGDRVLVSKYAYHLHDPHRFDIPVFKYPVEPFAEKDMQGMNYIKRLVGIGGESGETVAVFAGDLYTATTKVLNYDHIPADKRPPNENDTWHFEYMYPNDPVAVKSFEEGKFEIVRKTPEQILAVRRIVFDLDHQPKSAEGVKKTRWHPMPADDGAGWQMEPTGFKHTGEQLGWMRYQQIDPWKDETKPYLIVDALGYNHFSDPDRRSMNTSNPFVENAANRWVSDLILDCTVEIASPDSEVILELNKGPNRCEAIFAKGECRLVRYLTTNGKEDKFESKGSQQTKMNRAGTYKVRFANVDSRFTVWVDGSALAFDKEDSDYPPPSPTQKFESTDNDLLQPARIGANGQVTCSKVSLWRDLQYNCGFRSGPKQRELEPDAPPSCGNVQTYYVQPGHYLMFGDNVNSSADSRYWGLVPQRLMLGRAVVVYWPPSRVGVIE